MGDNNIYSCNNGCCKLQINPYKKEPVFYSKNRYKKAGVFIYDPKQSKILLVQSRGQYWGPPKGTLEIGESDRMCAVREVKEETGLDVDEKEFSRAFIKNQSIYYYLEMDECECVVQGHIEGNDVNGIGWVSIECLYDLVQDDRIELSRNCIKAINYFLDFKFL